MNFRITHTITDFVYFLFYLNQFYCLIRPNDKSVQQAMIKKKEIRNTDDVISVL